MWEAHYDNNSTVYGVCNCGLMYDRANALTNIKRFLNMDIKGLTHVVANPANVAKWAVTTKFAKCTHEPWHQKLANLSNRELYEWNPFPQPGLLKAALREHDFAGKLIWTLPFWCRNRSQANIYRRPAPPDILSHEDVDGFLDTSMYLCPDDRFHFRCQVGSCSKSNMGQHQCLPGPPDDMAASLVHLISTV